MTQVISIVDKPAESAVIDALRDAIQAGYESVIIFGFIDGQIVITSSGNEDNLRVIGAMEMAKAQLSATS